MTLVNASGVNRQHFSSSRGGWHTLLSKMMFTLVYRTSEITFFLLQKLQNSLGTRLRFRVWFSLDWVCNISSTSEPRTGPSPKNGILLNLNPKPDRTRVQFGLVQGLDCISSEPQHPYSEPEPGMETVQHQVRFGSVVSDCLETIPEVEEAEEDEGDGAGTSTGPTTQSRGKKRKGEADGNVSSDDNYDRMCDVFVEALNISRKNAKKEREEEKKEKEKMEEIEESVFTLAWGEDQGMLMQPIFNMWFKDMPKAMTSLVVHSSAHRYLYHR